MHELNLTLAEWKYMATGLMESSSKLPRRSTYSPVLNVTNFDLDDGYARLREDAIFSAKEVNELRRYKKEEGSWPRGRRDAKYWFRARWTEATNYVLRQINTPEASEVTETQPTDLPIIVSKLLIDVFNQVRVDFWLMENINDLTYLDPYKIDEEQYSDYQDWLTLVQDGHYLPAS